MADEPNVDEYRVSDGVLLRRRGGVITTADGRDYPGIVQDWYTNSVAADKPEEAAFRVRLAAG